MESDQLNEEWFTGKSIPDGRRLCPSHVCTSVKNSGNVNRKCVIDSSGIDLFVKGCKDRRVGIEKKGSLLDILFCFPLYERLKLGRAFATYGTNHILDNLILYRYCRQCM